MSHCFKHWGFSGEQVRHGLYLLEISVHWENCHYTDKHPNNKAQLWQVYRKRAINIIDDQYKDNVHIHEENAYNSITWLDLYVPPIPMIISDIICTRQF